MDICQTGNGFNGTINKAAKGGSRTASKIQSLGVKPSEMNAADRKGMTDGMKALQERNDLLRGANRLSTSEIAATLQRPENAAIIARASEAERKIESVVAKVEGNRNSNS